MEDNIKIRKIIREALFQNVDFGDGAPNDVAEAPPEEGSEEKVQGGTKESVPVFIDVQTSKKAFSKAYKKLVDYATTFWSAKRRPNDLKNFMNDIEEMNTDYNKIIYNIRKEYVINKKLTNKNIEQLKRASEAFRKFFKLNAPKSLTDKDVMAWYKQVN